MTLLEGTCGMSSVSSSSAMDTDDVSKLFVSYQLHSYISRQKVNIFVFLLGF